MTSSRTCPDCGKELPSGLPEDMCPHCLLRLGVRAVANTNVPAPETAGSIAVEQGNTRIGRYRLLEPIGEGGFGTVWMAEQTEPVRRKVALKIIKLGMDTKEFVARFEAERQALAMMDHPNIARVFDGGATEGGRPYFVMELVKGLRITDYCDAQRLNTEERLKLFMQVCQAVQHAHQKGIIHRDLKPSNVLVTEQDGHAVPKVIDFGVAKAAEMELTEKTFFTRFNQMIGTPAYMSPEQAGLGSLDVDTRSDIYSLGVLLYELLTGHTPFPTTDLAKAAFDEVLRTIREKDPPKPSTRLSTLTGEQLAAAAARRSSGPAKLNRMMRGEVDWIVMKCLEKDRARRYETTIELARDLERHLRNEPISARPTSAFYRFQKAVRRNKFAVSAAGAITVVLLVGIIVSTWQAIRAGTAEREQVRLRHAAEREQQRAQTESARSEQVAQFLTDMLKSAGPSVARGRDASLLREILDATTQRAKNELSAQPEVQGDLFLTVGRTYVDIGEHHRAIPILEGAVGSYRQAFAGVHGKLALALGILGSAQSFIERVPQGRANAQLGLDMARQIGDPGTLTTCLLNFANSLYHLGDTRPEAVPYLREALAIQRSLKTDVDAIILCLRKLSVTVTNAAEGEELAREGMALAVARFGETNTTTAGFHFALGQELLKNDNPREAEAELRITFSMWQSLYDLNHPYRGIILRFLLHALAVQGKWDEAEEAIRQEAIEVPLNPYCLSMLSALQVTRSSWSSVYTDLRPEFEAPTAGKENLFTASLMLAAANRLSQYRTRARELLTFAIKDGEAWSAEMASKAALVLPPEGPDLEIAGRLADFAFVQSSNENFPPWRSMAKALAEYRRGQLDSAHEWAKRAATSRSVDFSCQAAAYFIDALALGRSRQIEPARDAVDAGDSTVRQHRTNFIHEHSFVRDWVFADLLRREAVTLLEKPAAPAQ